MPRYGELEDEKIIPEGGGYPSKESDLSSFLKERLKKAKDEAGDTLRGVAGMSPGEGRSGDTLGYAGGRMIGSVASRGLTDAYANNKERVPNIIGNIAEKFAPSDLEKKTGVATDSRLQALMNLKNKDRDFSQDVKALRKDIGGTLSGTLPGQGGGMSHAMTAASIRAGEANNLAKKMQNTKDLSVLERRNVANISKANYHRLPPSEKELLKRDQGFLVDKDVEDYLDRATAGTTIAKGTDPKLAKTLGALYPEVGIARTGGTPYGTPGQIGYDGFDSDPTKNIGSMYELLKNAYR